MTPHQEERQGFSESPGLISVLHLHRHHCHRWVQREEVLTHRYRMSHTIQLMSFYLYSDIHLCSSESDSYNLQAVLTWSQHGDAEWKCFMFSLFISGSWLVIHSTTQQIYSMGYKNTGTVLLQLIAKVKKLFLVHLMSGDIMFVLFRLNYKSLFLCFNVQKLLKHVGLCPKTAIFDHAAIFCIKQCPDTLSGFHIYKHLL